jgi:hypothetical protein
LVFFGGGGVGAVMVKVRGRLPPDLRGFVRRKGDRDKAQTFNERLDTAIVSELFRRRYGQRTQGGGYNNSVRPYPCQGQDQDDN